MGARIRERYGIAEEYKYQLRECDSGVILVYGRLYSGFQEETEDEKFSLKRARLNLPRVFDIPVLNIKFGSGVTQGFFCGQIIAARGTIIDNEFTAEEVFTDLRLQLVDPIPESFSQKIVVCCGPYFKDDLSVLNQINKSVLRHQPDIALFLGPFVVENTPMLYNKDCSKTAEDLTKEIIETLSDSIPNSLFIGSPDDLIGFPFLPNGKIFTSGANYTVSGDPTFISIGPLSIAATAHDVQFATAKQFDGPTSGKLKEISKQFAHQCSTCPVIDPKVQLFHIKKLEIESTPHIFISPTRFVQSSEDIDGTKIVCVPSSFKSGKIMPFAIISCNNGFVDVTFQN